MTAPWASAFRESAIRPSAAGSSHPRLMAEKPKPEFPTPVAVTRHPKLFRPRVGLTTLGQPRLSEGAQPYPRLRGSAQRETGDPMISWGIHQARSIYSGFRSPSEPCFHRCTGRRPICTFAPRTARGAVPTQGKASPSYPVYLSIYEVTRACLLYTSPSPRDRQKSRMPSSA